MSAVYPSKSEASKMMSLRDKSIAIKLMCSNWTAYIKGVRPDIVCELISAPWSSRYLTVDTQPKCACVKKVEFSDQVQVQVRWDDS